MWCFLQCVSLRLTILSLSRLCHNESYNVAYFQGLSQSFIEQPNQRIALGWHLGQGTPVMAVNDITPLNIKQHFIYIIPSVDYYPITYGFTCMAFLYIEAVSEEFAQLTATVTYIVYFWICRTSSNWIRRWPTARIIC